MNIKDYRLCLNIDHILQLTIPNIKMIDRCEILVRFRLLVYALHLLCCYEID